MGRKNWSSDWNDLLTYYNNVIISYDYIGNPLNWGNGMQFTWSEGRRLAAITRGTNTVNYTYNQDGIRTSKTVNGVRTDYYLNGTTIVMQKTGDNCIWFTYDENGLVTGFKYNNQNYYYYKNLQGNIIGIIDESGAVVAEYFYDAWGAITYIYDGNGELVIDSNHIANINPFRYRGYYYDNESGFYYLNSRYYDPNICRFLNADGYASTGQGVTSNNMFVYCLNNPVLLLDSTGTRPVVGASLQHETKNERMLSFACMNKKSEKSLLDDFTNISEDGFTISLKGAISFWDSFVKRNGGSKAYDKLSSFLCDEYKRLYGKEFLFSNECVSWEIEYHLDAYMNVNEVEGYSRHITTYIFSKQYIIEHCEIINISIKDVTNLKQALVFGYKDGIRECYKNTVADPFINERW